MCYLMFFAAPAVVPRPVSFSSHRVAFPLFHSDFSIVVVTSMPFFLLCRWFIINSIFLLLFTCWFFFFCFSFRLLSLTLFDFNFYFYSLCLISTLFLPRICFDFPLLGYFSRLFVFCFHSLLGNGSTHSIKSHSSAGFTHKFNSRAPL